MAELMNRERRTVQMVTNNHCLVNPLNKPEHRMCPFEVINNVYFSFAENMKKRENKPIILLESSSHPTYLDGTSAHLFFYVCTISL